MDTRPASSRSASRQGRSPPATAGCYRPPAPVDPSLLHWRPCLKLMRNSCFGGGDVSAATFPSYSPPKPSLTTKPRKAVANPTTLTQGCSHPGQPALPQEPRTQARDSLPGGSGRPVTAGSCLWHFRKESRPWHLCTTGTVLGRAGENWAQPSSPERPHQATCQVLQGASPGLLHSQGPRELQVVVEEGNGFS